MTSIASLPQAAVSTPTAAAKVARAADGDYKAQGVGHEVKDSDGDYKPTMATASPASTTASSTLAAVTAMKLGG